MDAIGTIKVLLVDDESRFLITTASTLCRRGFDVRAAPGGFEAIRDVWKYDVDVVVLDIKMPGMDGHEVSRRIKSLKPDVEIIMLTGHGSVDSALESWRDEVFTYLTKPCDIDALAETIRCAYEKKILKQNT